MNIPRAKQEKDKFKNIDNATFMLSTVEHFSFNPKLFRWKFPDDKLT